MRLTYKYENDDGYGSCLIIIEEPLKGKVFQFGNYDRKVVYEHGTTKGYA